MSDAGCRRPDACQQALSKLYPSNQRFECLALDLTSLESVQNFADKVKAKNVPIQVLVNNGTTNPDGDIPDIVLM